jgi:hypothetical protein
MRKKLRVVDRARNYMRVQVVPVVIAVAQMLFEKVLKSVLWVGNGLDIVKPLHMTSHGTTPNLHEGGPYGPVVREKPGLEHLELANQGDAFERNPVVAERTVNLPNVTVHARFFLSFFPTCWLEVPKDNHALAAFIKQASSRPSATGSEVAFVAKADRLHLQAQAEDFQKPTGNPHIGAVGCAFENEPYLRRISRSVRPKRRNHWPSFCWRRPIVKRELSVPELDLRWDGPWVFTPEKMREAFPTKMLVKLFQASAEQLAAIDRILDQGKAENGNAQSRNAEPSTEAHTAPNPRAEREAATRATGRQQCHGAPHA